ncbi:MAG: ribbon-helix-helix domain-containing protein [Pseudosphingobacterium sp.]|nr:ribbon-helix-helix domain-containing protein [Pseudosphingobacterium sp.]
MKNHQSDNKRNRRFGIRLTEDEMARLSELEKTSGLSRSDLLRAAISSLNLSQQCVPAELLSSLDSLGSELGRSGNNINQLAHHANLLNRRGDLDQQFVPPFTELLGKHTELLKQIETCLRGILRNMANRNRQR